MRGDATRTYRKAAHVLCLLLGLGFLVHSVVLRVANAVVPPPGLGGDYARYQELFEGRMMALDVSAGIASICAELCLMAFVVLLAFFVRDGRPARFRTLMGIWAEALLAMLVATLPLAVFDLDSGFFYNHLVPTYAPAFELTLLLVAALVANLVMRGRAARATSAQTDA